MIRYLRTSLLAVALYGAGAPAQEWRGELLYLTNCKSCHTAQVHWREKQVATNREGLILEVRRWQANGNLDWSGDDVEAVAHYLDAHYYRYALPEN